MWKFYDSFVSIIIVLSSKIFWFYNYFNDGHGGHKVKGMLCVVSHFNTGIVGSYHTWATDVCYLLFIVHVPFCGSC